MACAWLRYILSLSSVPVSAFRPLIGIAGLHGRLTAPAGQGGGTRTNLETRIETSSGTPDFSNALHRPVLYMFGAVTKKQNAEEKWLWSFSRQTAQAPSGRKQLAYPHPLLSAVSSRVDDRIHRI